MTRIYLIRHCEAAGNLNRVFQGHTDSDISENGRRQLRKLSIRCRDYPFDAVYSSPLLRAYKTAEAANRYHGLPIVTRDNLVEINGGHWEGVHFKDLAQLYPEENRRWEEEPWRFRAEGGESMQEVYRRIWEAVTSIVRENPGRNVCVVSHGCAIRNFLCRAYGFPLSKLSRIPWCDNTAVSIVDFSENLAPTVVTANDASHLNAELSTLAKQSWWKKSENHESGEEDK